MIYVLDYLEAIDMKITGGSPHMWDCYGDNVRFIKSDSIEDDGTDRYASEIIFEVGDEEVRELAVYDYVNKRAYIWIHPEYKEARYEEAKERGIDIDQAWDDVYFGHVSDESDILKKLAAIVDGEEYDPRVGVKMEIDDDTLFTMMKFAHERDMTLNQYFESLIKDFIELYIEE